MHNTIPTLVNIVKNAESEAAADATIADQFQKLSKRAAKNVRQDVQDYIEDKMTESQLSYHLAEFGI